MFIIVVVVVIGVVGFVGMFLVYELFKGLCDVFYCDNCLVDVFVSVKCVLVYLCGCFVVFDGVVEVKFDVVFDV